MPFPLEKASFTLWRSVIVHALFASHWQALQLHVVRVVSFFMRRGGGGLKSLREIHFFSNLKRMGVHFFQSLILNFFFKKGMQYQKSECKLYYWATVCFSFKYGLAKILFNKPHSSILKDLFINKILYTISQPTKFMSLSSHLHQVFKLNHDPAKRPKHVTVLAKGTNCMSYSFYIKKQPFLQ